MKNLMNILLVNVAMIVDLLWIDDAEEVCKVGFKGIIGY